MAMQRAKDETTIPTNTCIVEAARAEKIPIFVGKRPLLYLEEDVPEDKTDEWGMLAGRLSVCRSEAAVKKGGPSAKPKIR